MLDDRVAVWGALMSGGTEAGELFEVIAGFMAWYLIPVALGYLMKMATYVCTSTKNTTIALNRLEPLP